MINLIKNMEIIIIIALVIINIFCFLSHRDDIDYLDRKIKETNSKIELLTKYLNVEYKPETETKEPAKFIKK